ncbi:HTH_Tnp_Tc3_2 domain-containing protein [Trichonephila clavipes]|nr:HTH_Tnp_Tc3_2 domain-containing protein [Trichonephila clavipes]
MIVSRIWNSWVQDSNTECRAGSLQPPITSSREDRHVIRMALMDLRRRLLHHELSARRPWLLLLLTLHHRQERLQWCDQRRNWYTDGEMSNFQINSGSVYNIKLISSVFRGIVVNTHWQRAFVIVILAHHLVEWYGDLLDIRLGCLLFATAHVTFLVCYDPCLYSLVESCETLSLSRIMHDRLLSVLYGPSLIRKMFGCCPG